MEFRIRPKSDYLFQAEWQQLYLLSAHWKSDMEFHQDEIRFLRELVAKYFIWLIKEENIRYVRELAVLLMKLDQQSIELIGKILEHMHHLELLQENAFSRDEQKFREEHAGLEESIVAFVKLLRDLKKKTFNVTENVIEVEKLQQLIR